MLIWLAEVVLKVLVGKHLQQHIRNVSDKQGPFPSLYTVENLRSAYAVLV